MIDAFAKALQMALHFERQIVSDSVDAPSTRGVRDHKSPSPEASKMLGYFNL